MSVQLVYSCIKAGSQIRSLTSTVPAVMAAARRTATLDMHVRHARVWRRLPYTTKKRVCVCFDCFRFPSKCFLGYIYVFVPVE